MAKLNSQNHLVMKLQRKYGTADPGQIQLQIIFVNLMALLKATMEDSPSTRNLMSQYLNDWNLAARLRNVHPGSERVRTVRSRSLTRSN